MKIHLAWIRVTATAAIVAGVSAHPAAAQYAPYRPIPKQPAAPQPAAAQPVPAAAVQTPYTAYQPQLPYQQPTARYQAPTVPYQAPTVAQYPQAVTPYPQTTCQYPTTYGAYPYVAQQSTETAPPAPRNGAAPAGDAMPKGGMPAPADPATNNGQAGCNCNGNYAAGDCYNAGACGCNSGSYPNYGLSNYFGDSCDDCNENQWFGGVYFLEMGRTNPTDVKLTSQMPTGGAYPYYPQPDATIMSSRNVDFDFREGLEVRFGSTFTIGDSCDTCDTCNGYGYGGCNSCGPTCAPACPTTYAWEVAWWGINGDENIQYVFFNGTDRIYGMKSYVGLEHDRDGAGATYVYRPVNDYYDYQMPIIDPTTATPAQGAAGYVRVVSQRVRTDFRAQNLELNIIRFPMCDTCSGGGGGCNGGCSNDGCGCDNGCNTGCESRDACCGPAFSMYGSCGVRYFRVDDDFMYGTQSQVYDGAAYGPSQWMDHNIDVENNLVGPQVGWTGDYCWGKWNLFYNSTFGIFDNHASVGQRMRDEDGNWARFIQDGSNFNVRTSKDSVAFLGELRVGTAYDFNCHWRGVIAYRAVAISGLATADEQLQNNYADRWTVGLIDSDNSMIIHGAQVGAECRY